MQCHLYVYIFMQTTHISAGILQDCIRQLPHYIKGLCDEDLALEAQRLPPQEIIINFDPLFRCTVHNFICFDLDNFAIQ